MNVEALRAADLLAEQGVSVEVVDPRTLAPLDDRPLFESAAKTGHCIVADYDWLDSGFSAEVAARVSESCFGSLRSPVTRIGYANTPTPTERGLENLFYPNAVSIVRAVEKKLGLPPMDLEDREFYSYESRFKGPF